MKDVVAHLQEKGLAESTIAHHLGVLRTLNGGTDPKSLAFLRDTQEIRKRLREYAPSTYLTMISTLVSVLSLVKDKPTYRKAYQSYYDEMMTLNEEAQKRRETSEEKSKKEEENWLTWEDVVKKRDELRKASEETSNWTTLLHSLLLSLYTEIPPRRNQDYLLMRVVKKAPTETDANYLVIEKGKPKRFVFHKYKTAKTHGAQTIEIPPALASVLSTYLKHHPKRKDESFPLLVSEDGTPLTAVNAITRILNRIFGKKVGSSMLRHIYLSSKYDIDAMKKDATEMAHSLSQQKEYMKSSQSVTVPTTDDTPHTAS